MHPSVLYYTDIFFKNYNTKTNPCIVEIGSYDVNGSLRQVAPPCTYIGLDYTAGPGVDRLISNEQLPVQDNTADFVISASCFEHARFFWETFIECLRVSKNNGIIMINAPSNSLHFHQYPIDAWRFMPDAGLALEQYGTVRGYNCLLIESFLGKPMGGSTWIDNVMVFIKDKNFLHEYKLRMLDQLKDFSNGRLAGQTDILNFNPDV